MVLGFCEFVWNVKIVYNIWCCPGWINEEKRKARSWRWCWPTLPQQVALTAVTSQVSARVWVMLATNQGRPPPQQWSLLAGYRPVIPMMIHSQARHPQREALMSSTTISVFFWGDLTVIFTNSYFHSVAFAMLNCPNKKHLLKLNSKLVLQLGQCQLLAVFGASQSGSSSFSPTWSLWMFVLFLGFKLSGHTFILTPPLSMSGSFNCCDYWWSSVSLPVNGEGHQLKQKAQLA